MSFIRIYDSQLWQDNIEWNRTYFIHDLFRQIVLTIIRYIMSIYWLNWRERKYIRQVCPLVSCSQHLEQLKLRSGAYIRRPMGCSCLIVAARVLLFSGQVVGVVKQSPPPRGPRFERCIAHRRTERMTRSKKKKARKKDRPDRHEARDYKRTRGTFAREYRQGKRDEKGGIIAPSAKPFVVISNRAYSKCEFFLEGMSRE